MKIEKLTFEYPDYVHTPTSANEWNIYNCIRTLSEKTNEIINFINEYTSEQLPQIMARLYKLEENSCNDEKKETEILPCPFCGEKPKMIDEGKLYLMRPYQIRCDNASCNKVSTFWKPTKQDAIKSWSKRA